MLAEFQQVLHTPKHQSLSTVLTTTQDTILTTFENIFPSDFDLSILNGIYEEVLGEGMFPSDEAVQVTQQQQILINYKLTRYFTELVKSNFVFVDLYRSLQEQTQKAEATIRSHIKIQQEMKMYLEYLQAKLHHAERELEQKVNFKVNLKRQLQILRNREEILLKQKIVLIKSNEDLRREIKQIKVVDENRDGIFLHPDDHARMIASQKNSSWKSSETKEKQWGKEREVSWHQDLTQKKKSSYFQ